MKKLGLLALITPVIFGLWFVLTGASVFLGVASSCSGFVIDSVTGTIGDGEDLTIAGCGFGGAPPYGNIIFDNADDGGTLGNEIDLTATIGTWDSVDATDGGPEYDATAFSGNRGMVVIATGGGDTSRRKVYEVFDTAGTEAYISFQVQVPDTFTFPGEDDEETFSTGASTKFSWILDENASDDDLIVPAHSGGTNFNYSGNDLGSWTSTNISTYWAWDEWNFHEWAATAGADPDVDTGHWWFAWISSLGSKSFNEDRVIFANGTAPNEWERFNVFGHYNRNSGEASTNAKVVYDDVYAAVGDNAQARVLICNATARASWTKCMIAPTTSWSGTSIALTLRADPATAIGSTAYLFVIDGDGNESAAHQILP